MCRAAQRNTNARSRRVAPPQWYTPSLAVVWIRMKWVRTEPPISFGIDYSKRVCAGILFSFYMAFVLFGRPHLLDADLKG